MNPQKDSAQLLFNNSESTGNNQDNDIDSKYQKRQENFSNQVEYSQIKENTMTNELSLGQNFRNKIFMQKRLKKAMNVEQTQSLKSKLTISPELFEKCKNEQYNTFINDILYKLTNCFRNCFITQCCIVAGLSTNAHRGFCCNFGGSFTFV